MKKSFFKIILCLTFINFLSLAFAENNYNLTIADKNGRVITNEIYSKNTTFLPARNPQNLVIKKYVNNKEQAKVINTSGKYLFNNSYEYINPLTSQIYIAEKNKNKYILKENGAILLTPQKTEMVEPINEKAFSVKEFNTTSSGSGSIKDNFMAKHKSVIYNNDMKKIYTGDMTYAQNIVPGYIFVKIDKTDGKIIDSDGKTILNGVKYCENYKPGIIYVKTESKEGIYDLDKHCWLYDNVIHGVPQIGSNYGIIPVVKKGETFRVLTDKNLKAYKPQDTYYYIIPDNNVFLASANGMTTNKVLNEKSKVLYSAKNSENIENATLKNVVVSKNGKYSLKTVKGKEILPAKYENITLNTESILTQNGKIFEILNGKYKTVSKFTANSAALRGNIVFVQNNDDCKLLDATTGKMLYASSDIKEYSANNENGNVEYYYIASKNGKKGAVNMKAAEIIPFEYDDITVIKHSTEEKDEIAFVIKKGNKYAISNIKTKSHENFVYSHQPVQDFDNFTILKNNE